MPSNELLSKLEDVADQVSTRALSISCWIGEFQVMVPHHQNDIQKFHFLVHHNKQRLPLVALR